MRIVAIALVGMLAMGAPALAQRAAPAAIGSPFVEHFPAFDGERWQLSDRSPSETIFSAVWAPAQAAFTPDGLVITLEPTIRPDAPKPYKSAELSSHEEFRYGYYEARLRAVRGGGIVSAFFTFAMPTGPNTQNEIDMEITGNAPTQIELTYHVNGQHIRSITPLGFDASEGLHTYAFDWRRDSIRWYIDNRLVHTSRAHVRELNRPHQIFTSLWNSVRMPIWLGPYDASAGTHTMTVACVAHAPRYSGRALCSAGAED
jgi:beta-glucanase (GH16 family)